MLPKLPRLRVRRRKSGACSYYFDAGGEPRRWIALGSDEARARKRYDEFTAGAPKPGSTDAMLADGLVAMEGKVKPGTLANYRAYRKHLKLVFDGTPYEITQRHVL